MVILVQKNLTEATDSRHCDKSLCPLNLDSRVLLELFLATDELFVALFGQLNHAALGLLCFGYEVVVEQLLTDET